MQKWLEPTVWHCNCHRTITTVLEFTFVKVDGKLGCNGKGKCSSFVLLCLSLVLLVRQLQSIVRVHQAWLTVDDVYVVSDVLLREALLYLEMAMVGTSNSRQFMAIGSDHRELSYPVNNFCKGHSLPFQNFKLRNAKVRRGQTIILVLLQTNT